MTGIDVVQAALASTRYLFLFYLNDLTEEDIFVRPAKGANHIAWQMGHLIVAERAIVLEQLPNAAMPTLPEGFAEAHKKEQAQADGPAGFLDIYDYLQLFKDVRAATMATVAKLTDADLDRPSVGTMAPFAPKLADMFLLIANHTLMHGGQFSVVRRVLGKPHLL